eukprot:5070239-Amphidinium_carterae.2
MSQSESPELSAKRKWISEQSADPAPGAQSKAKARIHVEPITDWLVVDVNDTPGFWPAQMKKTLMTDGKRVFNIAAQSTPRELGIALEIIKKHGKRLTPTWDFEAYRADVMQNLGRHYKAQVAPSSRSVDAVEPRQSRCATRIGDDQWYTAHSLSDGTVTGEIPTKGRSKLIRAESRRTDR